VRDHVWKKAGMEPFGGCLCIGCLERRLGRKLKPKDFTGHVFNGMPGSARLLMALRGDASMNDLVKSNTGLDELAARVKTAHSAIRKAANDIVAQAITAGLALIEARDKLEHGDWLPYLKKNCGLKQRTAYDYMLIAANRNKFALGANLGLKEILRQIKGDDPKDDGPASLYDKAQTTLLKKLRKLLPQEVEAAARRTIAELDAAIAAVKKPG
jgi:hypothetical protein